LLSFVYICFAFVIQLSRRGEIPLTGLTLSHGCAYLKLVSVFPTLYAVFSFMFSELMREVDVRFIGIDGIGYRLC